MKILSLHSWDISPQEAIRVQKALRDKIIFDSSFKLSGVKKIAGADVSYSKQENLVYGVVLILTYPELKVIEEKWAVKEASFPYVPGLLVFREGPSLIEAFEKIENEPDLVMFDGHGISHPRGIGIASHMGILLDKTTIGVAKTSLTGEWKMPGNKRGSLSPILKDGKEIGAVVRTKENVEPIFVSVGHKVDLDTAVGIALSCSIGYRLPEPVRQAHIYSNKVKTTHGAFEQPTLF